MPNKRKLQEVSSQAIPTHKQLQDECDAMLQSIQGLPQGMLEFIEHEMLVPFHITLRGEILGDSEFRKEFNDMNGTLTLPELVNKLLQIDSSYFEGTIKDELNTEFQDCKDRLIRNLTVSGSSGDQLKAILSGDIEFSTDIQEGFLVNALEKTIHQAYEKLKNKTADPGSASKTGVFSNPVKRERPSNHKDFQGGGGSKPGS